MKQLFLSSMFAIGMIATALVTSCEKKENPIAVTSVQLSESQLVMMGGGTAILKALVLPENAENKSVTWTSSNPEVATIDQNGLVTAIKEGIATIIITTQDGGKTAICHINVEPSVPYITMVTKKNIGESVVFRINVANEADKAEVWIDLNNNGKKDIGEDKIDFGAGMRKYRLQSQTITLYGKVTGLYCVGLQFTQLDVSKNTQLTYLNCSDNPLLQLDVSKNTQLIELDCHRNQLTQLDLSQNTLLQILYCQQNQLTQLDVSKNTQLQTLSCTKNRLTKEAIDKLIDDLPIKNAESAGNITLISNQNGIDLNYQPITNAQKQKAHQKNWRIWIH